MNDMIIENTFTPEDTSENSKKPAGDVFLPTDFDDEILEMSEDFNLDEFQVVRRNSLPIFMNLRSALITESSM